MTLTGSGTEERRRSRVAKWTQLRACEARAERQSSDRDRLACASMHVRR